MALMICCLLIFSLLGVLRWVNFAPSMHAGLFGFFYRIKQVDLPFIHPHSIALDRA
jgi:hypothetical protein